jgi:trehalose 6-phosphate phosphatase
MIAPRTNGHLSSATSQNKLPVFDLARIVLLLDVDGTLLDLAARPDEVHVPEELRSVLKALSECAHCALALVSGRPAAQLDALFSPVKLAVIGCHGAEIRLAPDAPLDRRPPLDASIRRDLYALAARHPGTLLEDKSYSIAIHYRGAPALEGPLLRAAEDFVQRHSHLELLAGKAVIEFKLAGYDKATACAELLGHSAFAGRTPVFLGDDVTDERVFRVLPEFSGIGISVGRAMEGAQFMLRSPAAVRGWLRDLAARGMQ